VWRKEWEERGHKVDDCCLRRFVIWSGVDLRMTDCFLFIIRGSLLFMPTKMPVSPSLACARSPSRRTQPSPHTTSHKGSLSLALSPWHRRQISFSPPSLFFLHHCSFILLPSLLPLASLHLHPLLSCSLSFALYTLCVLILAKHIPNQPRQLPSQRTPPLF